MNLFCASQLLALRIIAVIFVQGLLAHVALANNSVSWREVVTPKNARIGWGTTEITFGENIKKVYDSLTIATRQKGLEKVKVHLSTIYIEDLMGVPISVEEHSRVGSLWTRREANIRLPEVRVKIIGPTESESLTVEVPKDTRFDEGDGLIESWDFFTQPKLEFKHFNLSTQKVEQIVLERDTSKKTQGDGSFWAIRSVYLDQKLRQQTFTRLDSQNRLVERVADIGGTQITIRNTNRKTALSRFRSYDVIKDHSIKSPYTIPKHALKGHIRYRFSHKEGLPIEIPQTAEQSVTTQGKHLIVDVCSNCVSVNENSVDEKIHGNLDLALADTPFLQASHPSIQKLVKSIKNKSLSDEKKLEKLAKMVNKKLPKIEFVGHATAVQSLKSKSGDCTEFAVLYATLARAVGIPARVVSGLAYSRESFHGVSNVFIPHAWIQAWVEGKWRGYDATLGGFDSSHIALRISEGEPSAFIEASQLAAKLNWDAIVQVKDK